MIDRDRYIADVLEPARRNRSQPPEDLWVRYALTDSIVTSGRVDEHLRAVVAIWDSLRQQRSYESLLTNLRTQHAGLLADGRLRSSALKDARVQRRRRTESLLQEIAAGNDALSTASFTDLARRCAGAFTEAELRAELGRRSVLVVEPVAVPTDPPHRSARTLRRPLQALGLALSVQLLADHAPAAKAPLRVPGDLASLTDAPLRKVRDQQAVRPYDDPRKNATTEVLGVLDACRRDGGLVQLVSWELGEIGREERRSPAVTQKILAQRYRDVGLADRDARIFAVSALLTDAPSGPEADIERALATGELRAAQRLAAALPADHDLRTEIDATAAKVDQLCAQARDRQGQGDGEAAARLYHEALALAHDDTEIEGRLHAIPPPPPGTPAAAVDGSAVSLRWTPSPVQVGRVVYRVRRGVGRAPLAPDAGDAVAETAATHAVDRSVPAGVHLAYAVFAGRDGRWSTALTVPPVLVCPDPADLTAGADEDAVRLRWTADPATHHVVVSRRERSGTWTRLPAGDGHRTTLTSHEDRTARRGVRYTYRVAAVYLTPAGEEVMSPGALVDAVAGARAEPVTDLTVEPDTPGRSTVSWTPPPVGEVVLVVSDQPRWTAGQRLSAAAIGSDIAPATAPEPTGGGRVRASVQTGSGRRWVTPVTVSGGEALVGESRIVSSLDPVTGLRAERTGEELRLTWVFPTDATHARVRWWPAGDRGRAVSEEISEQRFRIGGAHRVRVGWRAVVIEVVALARSGPDEDTSAAVRLDVDAPARLRYRVSRPIGRWRHREFRFEVDAPTDVPELLLTHHGGDRKPTSPDGGQVLETVPAQRLEPDRPLVVDVVVPGRGWRMCFPNGDAGRLVIVEPPVAEMRR